MIDFADFQLLSSNICTLRETSLDSVSNEFMTLSNLCCVNFDKLKEEYTRPLQLSEVPKSVDALLVTRDDYVFLIEFKNGAFRNKKIFDVRLKLFDSLLILTDVLKVDITHTRERFNFILVYNEERNPISEISEILARRANTKFTRFSLERFESLYFKKVFRD